MEEAFNFSMPLNGTVIYLSLGSNLGNRMNNLTRARKAIQHKIGNPLKLSAVYESEAWGYTSTHTYYNCCMSVLTRLEPLDVLDTLLGIERSMGRVRTANGYADRSIDIDLLFYGNRILEHARLILPHPALHNRRFVLEPLAEIAPQLLHPLMGSDVSKLLDRCPDKTRLTPVKED
jgi:2-amino-4-hydroxy-6-hydroxymethyldihydropteridine diphosphokinase